jgi:2-polyprenyl-6-methoxyphenol hydroxylase-like FAD-dependent oxidoreductase
MRALIVGGGIGGLAAAVALRRAGVESLIIEKVADSRAVGAGLAIWPNAMNALRVLGLEDRVLASSSSMERTLTSTSAGRMIARTDFRDIIQEAGAPCVCIHRAALRRILLEALPLGSVQTGKRCTGIDNSTAILEGGERVKADVLIGADGIFSVVRERLHGARPPR